MCKLNVKGTQHLHLLPWIVLAYLEQYPDAKDTVEGINRWWLLAHGVQTNTKALTVAMNQLVLGGWIKESGPPAGRTLYALNQDRKPILQRLIEHPPQDLG